MLLLNIFVSVKSIHAASDAMFSGIHCLDNEVEKVAHHPSIGWHRVVGVGELHRFDTLDPALHLVHLGLDGRCLSEQLPNELWALCLPLGRRHGNLLFGFSLHEGHEFLIRFLQTLLIL